MEEAEPRAGAKDSVSFSCRDDGVATGVETEAESIGEVSTGVPTPSIDEKDRLGKDPDRSGGPLAAKL